MLEAAGNRVETVLIEIGEIAACTSGVSMYPMLRNRKDMAVIAAVNGELQKDDVALYRVPKGKLILHRIIKVKPDIYVIRGDNLYKKEYVPKEWVIGVLKGFHRGKRYVDCNQSRGYKVYILYIKISYPLRYLVFRFIRPIFGKFKRFLKKIPK